MGTASWDELSELIEQARHLPLDERVGFLKQACGDNEALLNEALSLFEYEVDAEGLSSFQASLLPSLFGEGENRSGPAQATQPADLFGLVGRRVAHYEVQGVLGRGGMGMVYRALDTKLNRTVALKFLPPSLKQKPEAIDRFIQEAQSASALDHPNIAVVHSIEEAEEGVFIVMGCYLGGTLKARIQNGPLSIDEACRIAHQLASALHSAHDAEIIHRDVKPSNIIMDSRNQAKLVDFGISEFIGQAAPARAGSTFGTVAYMAPEQITQEAVDHRADLWALGVVLFEMLAGRHPFAGDEHQSLLNAIQEGTPRALKQLRPEVPDALAAIVQRCLAKSPDARYPDAAALEADLADLLRPVEAPNRLKVALWIGALAALLLAGALWMRTTLVPPFDTGERRIAVLPFTGTSQDAEAQAFRDGLTEVLASQLSRLPGSEDSLIVVPASEIRARGVSSAEDAHNVLGTNLVVSGSIQYLDETLRATLNLIDARTGRQIRSAILEEPTGAARALQDAMLLELAEMLNLELQPNARQQLTVGGTQVPGAHEFYLQGIGHLHRRDQTSSVDFAITLFDRALEHDSLYGLAYAGLGEAYWRKFDYTRNDEWADLALRYSERALEAEVADPYIYISLGVVHSGTGEYEQALRYFNRALVLDPSNALALREMGAAQAKLGRHPEAEANLLAAINLEPSSWLGYSALGYYYFQHGRYDDAYSMYHQGLALTARNEHAFTNLGGAYANLGLLDSARIYFERANQIRPTYEAYSNLGTLYYFEGRYEDAVRAYTQALTIHDRDHRIWGFLASTYGVIPGHEAEMRRAYETAIQQGHRQLEVDQRDPETLSDLADYHLSVGDSAEADIYLQRAVALRPSQPDICLNMARVFLRTGDLDAAFFWLTRAVETGYKLEHIEAEAVFLPMQTDERFERLRTLSP